MLVLRNPDGTALQTLGYAHNLTMDLCYNETSTINFDVPAFVDGVSVPGYELVVGSRIVDAVGYGQFILVDPSVSKTGTEEIKSCKAYSLEYELTYKKITLEESTYNFWNPVSVDDTILGIILSYLPSWHVGEVSDSLVGRYRTFSVSNENIYNLMKSTLQDTYGCIFEFDTYSRTIHVRAASDATKVTPIYISLENLAEDVKVSEDTESIFTVLDVNGADGVTIRSVNPTGTNKIYNIDYYIEAGLVPEDIASAWALWKESFEANQLNYFNLTASRMMRTSELTIAEQKLKDLQADLSALEVQQSVQIEMLASLPETSSSRKDLQDALDSVNLAMREKSAEIASAQERISEIEYEKQELTDRLVAVNKRMSFENYFSTNQLVVLDRFFKEDSIQDSNFVAQTVEAYVDGESQFNNIGANTLVVTGSSVEQATIEDTGRTVWTIKGGHIASKNGSMVDADIIRATLEQSESGVFVMSAYLADGSYLALDFKTGCLSMSGSVVAVSSTSTSLSLQFAEGAEGYFTKNTTEYERLSVEWDLYEYGNESLVKLSHPSYSFDVTAANFFSLEEFEVFAGKFNLGDKLYLDLGSRKITPIAVGVSIDFEDLSSLKLKFGSTFNLASSSFELVDLLEQSVSMGKNVDANRYLYSSFVESGASTSVKQFMESALDVSKNAILSASDITVTWDASGLKARKWNADKTGYDPEQIAIINNKIVFTDDGWASAKIAIGKFTDVNTGDSMGIVGPYIRGTLVAGSNLVIESAKKSGEIAVFRVDANGASLHNASFELVDENRHIVLDPLLGFGIGAYPIVDTDSSTGERSWNDDNTNFWVDADGNVHFKGILEGASGRFTGEIAVGGTADSPNFYVDAAGNMTANSGEFNGTVHADKMLLNGENIVSGNKIQSKYLNLGKITLDGTTGNVTIGGSIVLSGDIDMSQASSITWGGWDPADGNGYSKSEIQTFINDWLVAAPVIAGGEFRGKVGSDAYNTRLVISGYGAYSGMKILSGSDSASNSGLFMITGTSSAAVMISHNQERFFFFSDKTVMAGVFCASEDMYGSSLPSSGTAGQLFFLQS